MRQSWDQTYTYTYRCCRGGRHSKGDNNQSIKREKQCRKRRCYNGTTTVQWDHKEEEFHVDDVETFSIKKVWNKSSYISVNTAKKYWEIVYQTITALRAIKDKEKTIYLLSFLEEHQIFFLLPLSSSELHKGTVVNNYCNLMWINWCLYLKNEAGSGEVIKIKNLSNKWCTFQHALITRYYNGT